MAYHSPEELARTFLERVRDDRPLTLTFYFVPESRIPVSLSALPGTWRLVDKCAPEWYVYEPVDVQASIDAAWRLLGAPGDPPCYERIKAQHEARRVAEQLAAEAEAIERRLQAQREDEERAQRWRARLTAGQKPKERGEKAWQAQELERLRQEARQQRRAVKRQQRGFLALVGKRKSLGPPPEHVTPPAIVSRTDWVGETLRSLDREWVTGWDERYIPANRSFGGFSGAGRTWRDADRHHVPLEDWAMPYFPL